MATQFIFQDWPANVSWAAHILSDMTRPITDSADWVLCFTFDIDPSMTVMDSWERDLTAVDGMIARMPRGGQCVVDVTVYAPGFLSMLDAVQRYSSKVVAVVCAPPIGVDVMREAEYRRRADESTLPRLMAGSEIADLLHVSRQRVDQLRKRENFPAPIALLRRGPVWDAAAVQSFADTWPRRAGRPVAVDH